jgi:hypothetical protein
MQICYGFGRSRYLENLERCAPRNDSTRVVSVQRLPYRSPALTEYGSVSKLTESAGSMNGDTGQNMMPCL